jgi:N-hydroxyarylamine O-acetyltransferase
MSELHKPKSLISEVRAYLQRIGYHGSLRPSITLLRKLHKRHLETVPFENLDIHLGRPIILDQSSFYKKIVEERRGGFCYELNGSFANLLRSLGFKVDILSAKVAGKDGKFSPDFDHMTLRVKLERPWLVDVGFGESFALPKLLDTPLQQREGGKTYKISSEKTRRILWRKQTSENSWKPQYSFTLRKRRLAEFVPRCLWQQTSPDSHFKHGRLVTRLTSRGRNTLTDKKFIMTRYSRKTENHVKSLARFNQLLRERFGIVIT